MTHTFQLSIRLCLFSVESDKSCNPAHRRGLSDWRRIGCKALQCLSRTNPQDGIRCAGSREKIVTEYTECILSIPSTLNSTSILSLLQIVLAQVQDLSSSMHSLHWNRARFNVSALGPCCGPYSWPSGYSVVAIPGSKMRSLHPVPSLHPEIQQRFKFSLVKKEGGDFVQGRWITTNRCVSHLRQSSLCKPSLWIKAADSSLNDSKLPTNAVGFFHTESGNWLHTNNIPWSQFHILVACPYFTPFLVHTCANQATPSQQHRGDCSSNVRPWAAGLLPTRRWRNYGHMMSHVFPMQDSFCKMQSHSAPETFFHSYVPNLWTPENIHCPKKWSEIQAIMTTAGTLERAGFLPSLLSNLKWRTLLWNWMTVGLRLPGDWAARKLRFLLSGDSSQCCSKSVWFV